MMFKKAILGVLVLLLVTVSFSSYIEANRNEQIQIILNDVKQEVVARPEMKDGSVFVPVRVIFEAIGVEYGYDSKTRTVSASKNNNSIQLTLGQKSAIINGQSTTLKEAVYTINGYTYVPLRLIGETFGADISWDGASQSVLIRTKPPLGPSPIPLKDEAGFNELKALTDSYPSQAIDHLKYLIVEKKDASWLHYYLHGISKEDIQAALEIALLTGHIEAVDYILTYNKDSITNTITDTEGSTLFLNTYVGYYWYIYIHLIPNQGMKIYKPSNTVETSLQLIDLLVSHGYKPSEVDLLRVLQGQSEELMPTFEKLARLGININKPIAEFVSLDDTGRNIIYGLVGKSNVEGKLTPLIVQTFNVASWSPDIINIRKFNTVVRLGGNLELLTEAQRERILYLVTNNLEFEELFNQLTQ